MNKQLFVSTLLKWLAENNISPDQVHVSHGGSMLMMNLTNKTDDIDLTVTKEIFDRFDNVKYPKKDIGGGRYLIVVTDKIDIHLPEREITADELVKDSSGIWFRDVAATHRDYKILGRPKDQKKINLLKILIED